MSKHIYQFTDITVPLSDNFIEDKKGDPIKDENGNPEYSKRRNCTLADLLARVKAAGIPESEYANVEIFSFTYPRCSDPYIDCVYHKPKDQKQIEKEQLQMLKKEQQEKIDKEERKKLREAKKLEKEKVIESLTEDQKKILGIKSIPMSPGYAGRDEIGGSDF